MRDLETSPEAADLTGPMPQAALASRAVGNRPASWLAATGVSEARHQQESLSSPFRVPTVLNLPFSFPVTFTSLDSRQGGCGTSFHDIQQGTETQAGSPTLTILGGRCNVKPQGLSRKRPIVMQSPFDRCDACCFARNARPQIWIGTVDSRSVDLQARAHSRISREICVRCHFSPLPSVHF